MKRIHIFIKGYVQGVFFRAFVRDRAIEMGLTGYVKNLSNDTIEIIAEGHEAKLAELIELCKKGPVGSQVEEVRVNSELYTGEFNQFKIKY